MPPLPANVYLKVATARFLDGTGCSSPHLAVESGKRTVQEWTEAVRQARDEHGVGHWTYLRTNGSSHGRDDEDGSRHR
ncbi:MAG: hypothetical protein HC933_00745 [Pleurocapsa sp. SU_196_0]|nr:hypothetical protein [Pleurocapsa sp. SU_196_0]